MYCKCLVMLSSFFWTRVVLNASFLFLCLFLIIHSDFLSFCFSCFHIFLFICLCCPFHILFLYFVPMALKTSMLPSARVLSRFSSPSLKSSYSRNLTLFLYQSDKPFWLGCSASLSTFIWVQAVCSVK